MGALKKMTRCGSISTLFAILIVLFGVSSSALTTFGKSNTNQQAPQTTRPPVKAKDCTSHADCATIQNTSCVHAEDASMRCLCGDFKAPINGYCKATFKGLRHVCTETNQCDIGMKCEQENNTKTTTLITSKTFMPSSMLNNSSNYKVCLCDKSDGFEESKLHPQICSSALNLAFSGILVPLMIILLGSSIVRKPVECWARI